MKAIGCRVIAVDFDGCICTRNYPGVGEPNRQLIRLLKTARSNGNKLILWTSRTGKYVDDAVKFCKRYGLEFDAVNENIPEAIEAYGSDSRKVFADVYIDDNAMKVEYTKEESAFWNDVFENVAGKACDT